MKLNQSQTSLNIGHVWSKTRSISPILEKPCLIIMKFYQHICLDEISYVFENGSKNRSQGQMLEKPCVPCRSHIFSLIIMKLD